MSATRSLGIALLILATVLIYASYVRAAPSPNLFSNGGVASLPGLPASVREKLVNCSKKLDDAQKKEFENKVQNWWKNFVARFQRTVKKIGDFFSSLVNNKKPTFSFTDPTTTTTPSPMSEAEALCREGAPDYNLPTTAAPGAAAPVAPAASPAVPAPSTDGTTPQFLKPPSANSPYPAVLPDGPPPAANDVNPTSPVIKDTGA